MSTNYYLYTKPACTCCGAECAPLHVGLSAAGWRFGLHVIPREGLNSLDDWRRLWSKPGVYAKDEYGHVISLEKLERVILNRTRAGAEPLRRYVDGTHCVGGDATCDYLVGEFS